MTTFHAVMEGLMWLFLVAVIFLIGILGGLELANILIAALRRTSRRFERKIERLK